MYNKTICNIYCATSGLVVNKSQGRIQTRKKKNLNCTSRWKLCPHCQDSC